MRNRSSIFSFDTLTGRPWPGGAFLLAAVLCGLFRFVLLAVADRLNHIPAASINPHYIAREDRIIREATNRPKVVLMGDSVMLYGVDENRLAEAVGLRPGEVVNLGIESGRAWDALVLLRRNPDYFSGVQLAVFNVALNQVTRSSAAKRLPHFYRFSTLREKWRADFADSRVSLLLDWAWPFCSERRDLATWLAHVPGRSERDDAVLRPAWTPEHMHALLARKQLPQVSTGSGGAFGGPIALSQLHRELLGEFVAHWQARHVPVLLVCMPVSPSHAAATAQLEPPPEFTDFKRYLRSLTGPGVALVDWGRETDLGFDDAADYLDPGHMTPAGAAKMSAILADHLDRLGWLPAAGRTAVACKLAPGR